MISSKFLLFQELNPCFCMYKIHIIWSEMKKVTVKNFIQDCTFLMAAQTLSIGRDGLPFSTKTLSFSASFACIVEELASLSLFSLSLIVGSKLYGFSLSKLEKLWSKSEKVKEVSLDHKQNNSLHVGEIY